jgi:transitional endoplasmic reticulum ATPase
MIDEAKNDDNSTVCMSHNKLNELKIFKGDPVLIRGKKRKETLCIALSDKNIPDDKILMNKCIRKNIRCRLGDIV